MLCIVFTGLIRTMVCWVYLLEKLHGIDVFNLLLLLSAQKIMTTGTSISKNIPKITIYRL